MEAPLISDSGDQRVSVVGLGFGEDEQEQQEVGGEGGGGAGGGWGFPEQRRRQKLVEVGAIKEFQLLTFQLSHVCNTVVRHHP